MGFSVLLIEWVEAAFNQIGYGGVVFFMALESMIRRSPPKLYGLRGLPSLQPENSLSLAWCLPSSLGTIIGSLIGYYMGKWGGYPVVEYFGKYLLRDKEHLEHTHRWFENRCELTVLITRFVPVVRHLISIPAGVAEMNLLRFCAFTLIGGTTWNTILLVVGMKLKENWTVVSHYSHEIDYVVVAGLVGIGIWWIRKQLKRRKEKLLKDR